MSASMQSHPMVPADAADAADASLQGARPGPPQAATLQQRVVELEAVVAACRLEIQQRDRDYAELHGWAQRLEGELERTRREKREEGEELHRLLNSRGYRLLQALWAGRLWAIPRASRREWWARRAVYAWRRGVDDPTLLWRWPARRWSRLFGGYPGRVVIRQREASGDAHVDDLGRPSRPVPEREGLLRGLVSIVLPVFNQANLLQSSVESVLGQTYPHLELIVVNDGSTDGVEQVLNQFVGDPRVRVLTQANQKLPKALSNGFDVARGEFWTWTSADNLMEPGQLERLVAHLERNPDVGMVYADYRAIDDRGALLQDPSFRPHNRRSPTSAEIRLPRTTEQLNTIQDNFIGGCFLYRGRLGRLIGEYDPQLGVEDYDYWMRMNTLSRIEHLGTDDLLYRYRVHDNSLNARAVELRILDRVQALMRYEAQRADDYRRPWQLLADEGGQEWLRRQGWDSPLEDVRGWSPGAGSDKCLAVCRYDSVPHLSPSGPLVATLWSGAEAAAPYKARHWLRETYGTTVSLSDSSVTSARLRLSAPVPVLDSDAPGALRDVLAFANNASFYGRTRAQGERVRAAPIVYWPEAEPLRVLLQVEDFVQGGMERVVHDLIAVLRASGAHVLLLVLGRVGEAVEHARAEGCDVVVWGSRPRADDYRAFLRERRVHVVNAHYSHFGAESVAAEGIPFVQTIHNSYVWLEPRQIHECRKEDAFTSAYTAVSATAAEYADLVLGLDVTKMLVAPNGIDLAPLRAVDRSTARASLRHQLGLGPNDFVFLNVASILATKAQRQLVGALRRVRRSVPEAKLVLLGRAMDKAYLAQVEEQVRREGLSDAVLLAGYDADPARFYAMADAFVLPSFWEGWSLALAEALAVGLPVVASNVGAAEDFADVPGVRLVAPPFSRVTELDYRNISQFIYADDEGFVGRLAEAMIATCAQGAPPAAAASLIGALGRDVTYARYVNLFRWLAQGGTPVALQGLGAGRP